MKSIINYNYDTLSCGFASPKKCGIESIIAGLGLGLTAATTTAQGIGMASANATNEKLTREGWKLQMEEAERNRQFNASEAEKTRDFYSESSIMARRAEAGLNTAMTASESAQSGATATGSPASLSSPIPMQNVGEAAVSGLSTAMASLDVLSKVRSGNADVLLKKEQVKGIALDNMLKEVTKNVTVEMQNETLRNLVKTGKYLDLQNSQLQQAMQIERYTANQGMMISYQQFRLQRAQETKTRMESLQIAHGAEAWQTAWVAEQKRYWNDFLLRAKTASWQSGGYKDSLKTDRESINSDSRIDKGEDSRWNISGGVSASGGFPIGANVSGHVEGGYNSGSTEKTSVGVAEISETGISTTEREFIQNNDFAKLSYKALKIIDEYENNPNLTKDIRQAMMRELENLNMSFQLYQAEMQQLLSPEMRKIFGSGL